MFMIERIVVQLADLYSWLIVIYALLTWIPAKSGWLATVDDVLGKMCNPYLDLFKRLIPPIGGMVDITPIIALLVLQFGVRLIVALLNALIFI